MGHQTRQKKDFKYRSVLGSLNFLTNSTHSEAQFEVHQCTQFSADPKLPHDQAVKQVLEYLKGTATQGLIMNPDIEKEIGCYLDAEFASRWNQEEGKDPGSFLSITGNVITYANCPIIWAIWLQTEILVSTMELEYIALSQEMMEVLNFVSLMKEIEL